MLRLVAYLPDGVRRIPLVRGEQLLGSSEGCDILLPFPGVAKQHAIVRRGPSGLEIEGLEASPAVLVNGSRTRHAVLEVLDEVRIGNLVLLVEDSAMSPPVSLASSPEERTPVGASVNSQSLLEWLSRLSGWVVSDSESRSSLESLLQELLDAFGGGAIFLFQGAPPETPVVRLAVTSESSWLTAGETLVATLRQHARPAPGRSIGCFVAPVDGRQTWVAYRFLSALERDYFVVWALPEFDPGDWSPELGLAAVADLVVLGMVHHVGRYEPILPGHGGRPDLVLAQGLVLGPSPATQTLLRNLKQVAGAASNLLMIGEVGSGRELVARTLHHSGPRRGGPFVVVRCDGASEKQLEIEIFGAEIAGKKGPVRRESKLRLADRGTLFLDQIERLPLNVQARLVRVLRSGVIEGPGDGEREEIDVQIMASSNTHLATLLALDEIRVDLLFLIAEMTLEVPPLRDRREDLPLILQTCVNRFSHETGKRVRGITVSALSALTTYRFPGNLRELENAVRQMIYMARDGEPMDVDLLPTEIGASPVIAESRIDDQTAVLDLSELVGGVEQAAIREALRRSGGNKSQAARLLGVSRNGLAQKMSRYGV